jgi:flagellar basal body-associated protein FliL
MSPEQRRDFSVPSLMLSIVLFLSVIITLAASMSMLVFQLAHERARVAREELASKARRLRSKANGNEVMAPNLEKEDCFHTFLSHVWGTVCVQEKLTRSLARKECARLIESRDHTHRARIRCASSSKDYLRWYPIFASSSARALFHDHDVHYFLILSPHPSRVAPKQMSTISMRSEILKGTLRAASRCWCIVRMGS